MQKPPSLFFTFQLCMSLCVQNIPFIFKSYIKTAQSATLRKQKQSSPQELIIAHHVSQVLIMPVCKIKQGVMTLIVTVMHRQIFLSLPVYLRVHNLLSITSCQFYLNLIGTFERAHSVKFHESSWPKIFLAQDKYIYCFVI